MRSTDHLALTGSVGTGSDRNAPVARTGGIAKDSVRPYELSVLLFPPLHDGNGDLSSIVS